MSFENEVRLVLPAKSVNEGYARVAVAALAAQADPTAATLADVKTAVSEAVTNAIVHAYRGVEGGRVYIKMKLDGEGLMTISVRDTGCGIADVKQALEPCFTTAAAEERSGMGFSIMAAFMDSLKVRSAPGRGTTVTMKKRLLRE
ncbi:MAG: anti-sigma F factor [Clostridia bacterium]|nr:anti-sigma F factor [Clostridia bacterium]